MQACELLLTNMGVLNAAIHAAQPELAAIGLEPKELFLLSLLDDYPHPAELARVMVMPSPTVTFLAKRSEASGLLRREAVPSDLRKFKFTLTPKGRKAMERGRLAINHAFGERLKRLESRDTAAFERIIATLAAGHDIVE